MTNFSVLPPRRGKGWGFQAGVLKGDFGQLLISPYVITVRFPTNEGKKGFKRGSLENLLISLIDFTH